MATGTAIAGTGLILTAHFVLIGAESVDVTLSDERTLEGQVVAIDYDTGLGLVSTQEGGLAGLSIRSVDDLDAGEEAFLVASVGEGRRVNSGFLTSLEPFEAFWEYAIDPALFLSVDSPGLGGGPLIDNRGSIIGVAVLSLAEIGRFTVAVPASHAGIMIDAIERSGVFVPPAPRAWLGITCLPLAGSVALAGVLPDSPAQRAGLRPGDVVLEVEGEEVGDRLSLYRSIWKHSAEKPLDLRIVREGKASHVSVVTSSLAAYFS